jgi:hypothetical protein
MLTLLILLPSSLNRLFFPFVTFQWWSGYQILLITWLWLFQKNLVKKTVFCLGGMGPDITCCYPPDGAMSGLVKEASLDFLSRKNGPRSISTLINRGVTLGNCVIIPNVREYTLSWFFFHGAMVFCFFTHYFSKAK